MAIVTTTAPIHDPPVEACLAQLLDHFGIPGAHFAGRSLADVQDFIAKYPERIASLTLVCPTVLNPRSGRCQSLSSPHDTRADRARMLSATCIGGARIGAHRALPAADPRRTGAA